MKKILTVFISFVFVGFILIGTSISVNAAETNCQNGIKATIKTNKNDYSLNEDIDVSILIENTNSYAANDVSITVDLPKGLDLKSGDLSISNIDIGAGETYEKKVTATKSALPTTSEDLKSENSNNDKNSGSLKTGDNTSNVYKWLFLMILSLCILIIIKFWRKMKKLLCLLLCLAMISTMNMSKVFAYNSNAINITIEKKIIVDNEEYIITSHVTTKTSGEETVLKNFNADEIYFICGEESTITFTVDVVGDYSEINLFENDEKLIGLMHDDGLNGDAIANDGTYTYVLTDTINSDSLVTNSYFVQASDQISEKQNIYYFVPLTEETATIAKNNYNSVLNAISDVEKKYLKNQNYIESSDIPQAIADINTILNEYKEKNIILLFEEEDGNFEIKFTSGLSSLYVLKSEKTINTDSLGADVSVTVSTYQPCFTDMGGTDFSTSAYDLPDGVNYVLEMLDDVALDLDNKFNNFQFSNNNNYDDEEVTLNSIKSLHANQIVLWHGHGYYGPMVKSCLMTGEDFDWDGWWWDTTGYFADCVSNRIINSMLTGYDKVIISSKYIKKYCKNMDNSLIYLAACNSGKSSELANAFLDKGATAVVANDNTIQRSYNVAMLYETLNNMTKINNASGEYYTLQEALNKAKNKYGQDDNDNRYNGVGAKPKIFGGDDANNYQLANVQNGKLSGKVCKASDHSSAISNAKINIFKNNSLYKTINSDESGNYSINLPSGNYYLTITAHGYIKFNTYATVVENTNTYMEAFLMIEGEEGDEGIASGAIINSLTGKGVENVKLSIRKDWNNQNQNAETITTVTTDVNGNYTVNLPLGNYTVAMEKEGYLSSSFNIIVQSGTTENQNGVIVPTIYGDDYLITLTWDENPRDLDSHVHGTLSNGNSFHVYYRHKSEYDGDIKICNLDYDDTDSYGPEHVTLKTNTSNPYYYYIYKYAGNGTIASSNAKVTVHKGNKLIAEYNVPTNLGNDDYWNVFAIKNGKIVTRNTITSSADITYAN